tara:strand:- start:34 stop:399 length:366 start_codon:yes stop_codon:yes gene_type:complete
MKKIIKFLILILSINTFAAEEVLYCVEEKKIGFEPSEDYKQYSYSTIRFTAKVDFVKKSFSSADIFFTYGAQCKRSEGPSLKCRNQFGSTFTLFENDLKFVRTSTYVPDSVYLAHGYCESF